MGSSDMRKYFNDSDAEVKAKQLNAITLNIFERGADGVEPDSDMVGVILDLSCYLVNWFKSKEDEEEQRQRLNRR